MLMKELKQEVPLVYNALIGERDIYMAQIQPYYNMYALRKPLVYQCGERGGREECTKITFQHCEKRLPPIWLKKDLACIEMRL